MPLSAEHARHIARANGAPPGFRKPRQKELTRFVLEQLQTELGLPKGNKHAARLESLLKWFANCARTGVTAPGYDLIAERYGLTRPRAAYLVDRLVAQRLIVVRQVHKGRGGAAFVVTIVASGAMTADPVDAGKLI